MKRIFFIYGTDIAGASSQYYTDASGFNELKWFVKETFQVKYLLLMTIQYREIIQQPFYAQVFDSLGLSSKVDYWNIDLGKTSSALPVN
jgi:hypothetical protein